MSSTNNKKMHLKSLQVRIMLIILIFLFIPVSVLLNYNFSYTESVLQQKTSSLILVTLEQIGNKIENVSQDIMKISSIIGSDDVTVSYISNDQDIDGISGFGTRDLNNLTVDELIRVTAVERQINYVKSNFFNYNTHVVVFGSDGIIYSSLGNINDEFDFKLKYINEYKTQSWYKELESGKAAGLWTAPFTYDINGLGSNQRYISLSRVIRNNYTQAIQGIIMVNFSEEDFKRSLGSNVNGMVALLNKDNEVIFTSDTEKFEKQLLYGDVRSRIPEIGKGYFSTEIDNKKYLINYYTMDRIDWTLVSVLPYNDVMSEITSLRFKAYTINFIIFGIFLFIAVGFLLYITNPLKRLIARIRKMKIGYHSIGLKNMEFSDDVSGIVDSFEYMFRRVEELVEIVIKEQKYESDLKYEALRAQINPHFLFNTLNTIKFSAIMSGSENVSNMISALGQLLEISMNKGKEEITLKEELELAEAYVYIQNIRYNNKFKLTYHADEQISDYKILKLLLQPIVENSIIHGLKHKTSDGEINITTMLKEEKMIVTVSDNGIGISKEIINRIMDNDCDLEYQKYSNIGLINIHERLRIKYGHEYGLELESEEGKGTTVSVILPIIKADI